MSNCSSLFFVPLCEAASAVFPFFKVQSSKLPCSPALDQRQPHILHIIVLHGTVRHSYWRLCCAKYRTGESPLQRLPGLILLPNIRCCPPPFRDRIGFPSAAPASVLVVLSTVRPLTPSRPLTLPVNDSTNGAWEPQSTSLRQPCLFHYGSFSALHYCCAV